MKFLHLIWSNLKRKKLRTLLTATLCAVIVLAAAVAILIMMLVAQRS